jgi:di/tricarboxylate transporter
MNDIALVTAMFAAAEVSNDNSPRPVLMNTANTSAAASQMPVATPTNPRVMGPSGYPFSNYWKLGLPLPLWLLAAATFHVPLAWWY